MNADLSIGDSKGGYWCSIFGCLRLREPAGHGAADSSSLRRGARNLRRLASRPSRTRQGSTR